MEQVLRDTKALLGITFSSGAADGTVNVTITNADGDWVGGPAPASHGVGGAYTFNLPPQPDVASLTLEWVGTWSGVQETILTQVEIVGNHLFTLAELRAFAGGELASAVTYPDATLADKRGEITDQFEQICGVSFIPRYRRWTFTGNGSYCLWLPNIRVRQVLAVTVNGTAYTAPQVAALNVSRSGEVFNQGGWPYWTTPNNITIGYEHGWDFTPSKIKTIGMALAHYELTGSRLADRMLSMTNEFGIVRQSIPSGFERPTGLLIVDAVLCQYSERMLEVCG